jgi:hypothetical protein
MGRWVTPLTEDDLDTLSTFDPDASGGDVVNARAVERRGELRRGVVLTGAVAGVVWVLARFEAVPDSVVVGVCALLVVGPLLAPRRV